MQHRVECAINTGDQLGETPLWCPRSRKLWWIDIERPKLQSFEPATGRYDAFPFASTFLGSLALHREGGFLLALDNTLNRFDPATGVLTPVVEVEPAAAGTRLNDGRCDRCRAGSGWARWMRRLRSRSAASTASTLMGRASGNSATDGS